ncbi:DNA-directed RNA polymerase [Ranunculus cassubicifolius]
MSEVQEKDKALASVSEPEKVPNETSALNAENSVADGNNGKDKVDPSSSRTCENSTKTDASGSEPKTPSKNAAVETVASELIKSSVNVPGEISGGKGKIEENKNEVNNKVSTPGSKKRKRKKVLRPKNKAAKKADTETAASVKLNVKVPTAVSGDEKKAEDDTKEENKEENKKSENLRKRKKKKLGKNPADLVPSKDANKPESSKKNKDVQKKDKDVQKSERKGMIFMCSSKTKQDCYNYKVFGLPANKKDTVAKIYNGMRLFLFDIDLKLLYGVYKAEGPGGYNLEPKAFKSAFPSQVRFTMMEDCLPLAEENFKAVIKDNYYARNKFDCQLSAEQVKNLCKLFKDTTAKAGGPSKQASGTHKPEPRPVADRSRDRAQGGRDRERRQSGRDADRRQGGDRDRRESDRRKSGGGSNRYERDRRLPAPREERREAYPLRLLPLPLPQPQPQPQSTYAYERPPVEYYRSGETSYDRQVDESLYAYSRRDPVPLSYHESLYASRVAPLEPLPPSRTYPELVYTTRVPPPESSLSYHDHTRVPPPESSLSYHDPVYTRDPPSLTYIPSHPAYHRY